MNSKTFISLLLILLFVPFVVADSPQPDILLVKDAHYSYIGVSNPNEVYGSYYENALENNSLKYDVCTVKGKGDNGPAYDSSGDCQEAINGMKNYDMVIWFTGDDYGGSSGTTLTSTDQAELETYLDNGGKLFISGQDIGYDIGTTDFYENYLHAIYCDDDSNDITLTGENNNPVGDGLLIDISGGAGNQEYPSLIWHDGSSLSDDNIFAYKTEKSGWYQCDTGDWYYLSNADMPGAVKDDTGGPSGYKTVYFAFGFEAIEGSSKRKTVMDRIFNYLTAPKTKNAKIYPRSLDNTSYVDLNVSCDPDDDYCLREMDPKINATCKNYQLFANVSGAEYIFNGHGENMTAVDGDFDEDTEKANEYVEIPDIRTEYEVLVKDFSFSVHCNDTDGYWGRYDNYSFRVDVGRPSDGSLSVNNHYTASVKPSLEIDLSSSANPPDFMRFSCNKTNWTFWRTYSSTYSNFNITNPQAGCSSQDGNRTIYLQTRDRAGNLRNYTGYTKDWIILDRKAPQIVSVVPANNSYLSPEDNITINVTDELSGLDKIHINNGTDDFYFSSNISFDPGWASEGENTLKIWVNDSIGNTNYFTYNFKLDKTPPTTSDNSTGEWINQNQTISLTCSDPNLNGIAGSGCNITLYCVNSSGSCVPNQVYNPSIGVEIGCGENQVCVKYVVYYSNDSVNNTEPVRISTNISIDKKAPEVEINSPSSAYHKDSITINTTVIEGNLSIDKVLYNLSNSSWSQSYLLSQSGNNWLGSYDTNNIEDGEYNITILANDTVGNLNNSQQVNISVDNTPPSTSDYITGVWRNSNKSVNLTCSDNNGVGCNITLYCVDTSGTCSPNQEYTSPFNITCPQGETCERYVRYKSNDTLGNTESIKTSSVKIDKEEPDIQIDSPTGGTYSGIIDLKTTITDSGIGVNKSWYQVLNTSNLSQEFDSGILTGDYDTTWNSNENISGTETVMFNVSANDSLGNINLNVSVIFEVNNQKPSVVIKYPDEIYLNSSFNLNLTAEKTANNISYASYNISNSTWNKTNSSSSGINQSSYTFTDYLDLSSWSDGNYTLNFTANDTNDRWGEDYSWFVIDRLPPETNDSTNSSEPWYKTDQTVNLTCSDPNLQDGTTGAGCDTTLHCINSTGNPSCTLNKTSIRFEVTCSQGETCKKQIVYHSNDSVGNWEDLNVSYKIQIDKEAPNTTDNTTGNWYKTNQSIKLNSTDKGVGNDTTLYCVDTSGTCTPTQVYSGSFEVGCSNNSVCEKYVRYKSNDTLGNLENTKTSKKVKVDKSPPSTSDNTSSSEPWYSTNQTIKLVCSDDGSGCNKVEYCIGSLSCSLNKSKDISSGATTVEVGCPEGEVCELYLRYRSNDSVGNLGNIKNSSMVKIDKESPNAWNYRLNLSIDENFNDTRVYPGDVVKFSVNISDLRNISYIKANISKPSGQIEKTLTRESGNVWNGTWSFTYSPNNLGFYKIQSLTVNDSLGNIKIVAGAEISKNFTVVNATLGIKLDSNSSINAGFEKTFNLTFNFNKTFSSPNLTLYIPPNSPTNLNQTPRYINLTSYSSSCKIVPFSGNQSTPIGLNLSCINLTEFSLASKIKASSPIKDTNDTWIIKFHKDEYENVTHTKTPYLNISRISCNGNQSCIVNQSEQFELNITLENIHNSKHTGTARNTFLKLNSSTLGRVNLTNLNNISSGENKTSSYRFNITQVGNYTLSFKAWEFTKEYNTTRKKTIEVKDKEKPELLKVYWSEDNKFNRNESLSYYVKGRDNVKISNVWVNIQKGNYNKNKSLILDGRYDEYDLWKLSYQNDTTGNYSLKRIWINDTENNLLNYTPTGNKSWFLIKKLKLNISLLHNSTQVGTDQIFFANITGNASSVDKLTATIKKPRNYTESLNLNYRKRIENKLNFNGTYSNVSRSGNYSVNISVFLSSGVNLTKSTNFTSQFGETSINVTNEHIFLRRNSTYNLTWFIFPINGDLINVSGSLQINGSGKESLVNISSEENLTKNFGNITWEHWKDSGLKVGWLLNTSNSTGQTNATLSITPSKGNSANKTILINVTSQDEEKPDIWSVSHEWDKLNLLESNTITVNTTDNKTSIDHVLVELSYPNTGSENLSASLASTGNWTLEFKNTNETGNFSYRTLVYDVAGNLRNSSVKTFNVTDKYETVSITHNPYNKGDNVTFNVEVRDIRNQLVEKFNLTLILNKNTTSSNETLVNNSIASSGSYQIQASDNPPSSSDEEKSSTYVIYTTVSKNGNEGSYYEKFTVSEELETEIISPQDGDRYSSGEKIGISASVRDKDNNTIKDAAVTAFCGQCSETYKRLPWNSTTQTYYKSSAFTAPSVDSFSIGAYSVDFWKNKGKYPGVLIYTGEETTTGGGAPTEGGGGAAGAAPLPKVNVIGPGKVLAANISETILVVKTKEKGECEYSPKEFSYGEGTRFEETNGTLHRTPIKVESGKSYYFKVKCQVNERIGEDSVAFSVGRKEIKGFNVTIEKKISIVQGKTKKLYPSIYNPSRESLEIEVSGESECCKITGKTVKVNKKSEKTAEIKIHSPLSSNIGKYEAHFEFKSKGIVREKVIEIEIEKNELIEKLERINSSIPKTIQELKDFEKSGINTTEARKELEEIKSLVKKGKSAIKKDKIKKLEETVNKISGKYSSLENWITKTKIWNFLIENRWNILFALIIIFIITYFSANLFIPYFKLTLEIRNLKKKENEIVGTRRRAEKQYFKRKIDEETFREIVTKQQSKVLRARNKIKDKEKEKEKIIKKALKPKRFVLSPYRALKELLKKLRNIFKKKNENKEYMKKVKKGVDKKNK